MNLITNPRPIFSVVAATCIASILAFFAQGMFGTEQSPAPGSVAVGQEAAPQAVQPSASSDPVTAEGPPADGSTAEPLPNEPVVVLGDAYEQGLEAALESALSDSTTYSATGARPVELGSDFVDITLPSGATVGILTYPAELSEVTEALSDDCTEDCGRSSQLAGRPSWVYQTGDLFYQLYFSLEDGYVINITVQKDMSEGIGEAIRAPFPVSVEEASAFAESVAAHYRST